MRDLQQVYAVIWSTVLSAERIRPGYRAATVAGSSPARMAFPDGPGELTGHLRVAVEEQVFLAREVGEDRRPGQAAIKDGVPGRLSELSKVGVQDLRRFIGAYAPSRVRQTMQQHIDAAREQQKDFAARGEAIGADWKQAAPVKDAKALVSAVRSSKGPAEIVKSVRSWLTDYPASATTSTQPAAAAEPAKSHPGAPAKTTRVAEG